jgi:DNA-binding SARP family transcriptional activator
MVTHPPLQLHLLGGFRFLVGGRPVQLPAQAQRLLALLALRGPQSRSTLAGLLWGDVVEARAQAYLRNAIWRVRQASEHALHCARHSVGLAPDVAVDVAAARWSAIRVLEGRHTDTPDLLAALDQDLLPSWDEDWLLIDRERQRQLRLHALEALSDAYRETGRYGDAITAALAAVRAEPLRESAQFALIGAHLAENNVCEALRQLESYRRLLAAELGIRPSCRLTDMVRDALAARGHRSGRVEGGTAARRLVRVPAAASSVR